MHAPNGALASQSQPPAGLIEMVQYKHGNTVWKQRYHWHRDTEPDIKRHRDRHTEMIPHRIFDPEILHRDVSTAGERV